MPTPIHQLWFTTLGQLPEWPVVQTIARERAERGHYHHQVGWRHGHPQAGIQITLAGCGACRAAPGQRWRDIPPDTALVFDVSRHPDCEFRVADHVQDWEFLWLKMGGATALDRTHGLVRAHGHVIPFPHDHPLLRRWLRQLARPGSCQRTVGAAESAQIADSFLHVLASQALARGGDDTLVEQAITALSAAWTAPPTIGDLAASLDVSREHLVRRFRAATGEPPSDWLRRHRIERTVDLLAGSNQTIQAVAAAAGFSSPSRFIRTFRTVMGETPEAYRRRRKTDSTRR